MDEFDNRDSADQFEDLEDPAAMRAWVDQQMREALAKQKFAHRLNFGAEMHWFFFEGLLAHKAGRFIAATLCYLHGIEATVRWLHLEAYPQETPDLDPKNIFSHRLLRELEAVGYRVQTLAFPDETDFQAKLSTNQKPYIELLRQRNNIAHGNVVEYFQTDPEVSGRIFTPECLRDLANTLHDVADAWTQEISRKRTEDSLTSQSTPASPMP